MLMDSQGQRPAVPRHVAIIMDGNGRWAQRRRLPRPLGHREGVRAVRRIVRACDDRGVEALTLFAFSSENWNRPMLEVALLMRLFVGSLRSELKELRGNGVRIRFIGNRARFSARLRRAIADAEDATRSCTGLQLVVAADYGGRWDIAQAARQIALRVKAGELDPDRVDEHMLDGLISTADLPPVDLLIRTGGEHRVSNFLLWQIAYTELHFSDRLWPEFDAVALDEAFGDFSRRQRRFGMTPKQIQGGGHA